MNSVLQLDYQASAYGDLDAQGNVLLEGFTVERYCDFVLNPSYQVYLDKNSRPESTKRETTVSKESITNNNDSSKNKIEEKKSFKEKHTMTIEERNLNHNAKKMIAEAKAKNSLADRLSGYKEVLEYCEGVEFATSYIEEATKEIDVISKEMGKLAEEGKKTPALEESVKTKEQEAITLNKQVEDLKREINEVQEKYDISCQFLDDMKIREKKFKEMYDLVLAEKNGMVNPTDYKEVAVFTETMEKEMAELKLENSKLRKRVNAIIETAKKQGIMIRIKEADETDKEKEDKEKEDEKKEEAIKLRKKAAGLRKEAEESEKKADEKEKEDKEEDKKKEEAAHRRRGS